MGLTRRGFIATAGAAAAGVALGRGPVVRAAPGGGVWLAGDLHCHTCYSHDVWCAADDNTGPEEIYTAGFPASARYRDAALRGLGFLAITDHDDIRSFADAAAASGVVAIPAYEASIRGHAQMLGAKRSYDKGDGSAAAAQAMADALRADGGVFQANHPAYRLDQPFSGCAGGCGDCGVLHWKYGFDVRPDTVEVWNPSAPPNEVAELYWECWLERGERIGATGGSDSHWAALTAVAGLGQPTTWVHATDRSAAGVLAGLRAGRTSISWQPPLHGGPQLTVEAPGGAGIGDEVAPGAPLTIRAPGLLEPALVRIRANGEDVSEHPLAPGGSVTVAAPAGGWVRAILLSRLPAVGLPPNEFGELPVRDGMRLLALTSALYVVAPAAGAAVTRLALPPTMRRGELTGPGAPVAVLGAVAGPVRVTVRSRLPGERRERVVATAHASPAAGRVQRSSSQGRATSNSAEGRVELRLRADRDTRRALRALRRPLAATVVAQLPGGEILRKRVRIA